MANRCATSRVKKTGNLECQITLEIRIWIVIVIQTIFCVNHI